MNIWIGLFITYYIACVYGMCRFIYKEEGYLNVGFVLACFVLVWIVAPFFVFNDVMLIGKNPKKWNEK